MKSNNIIEDKTIKLSVRIVNLYKFLSSQKKEFVMSKQLLRSGTSIGANVQEAIYSESKADFKHKMGIAQKETAESIYWIKILYLTQYLSKNEYQSINNDLREVLRIIKSIIVTSKNRTSK